jgi:hypothetical protein
MSAEHHHFFSPSSKINLLDLPPNGLRYPLVGGTRERRFAETNFKPRKTLENAQTPTRRVHALLGAHEEDMRRRNSGSRIAFASSFFAPRNATNRANP